MEPEAIGRLLKQARLSAHLTQVQLSHLTGIDTSHISRIEQGKRGVTFTTWHTLMEACRVSWWIETDTLSRVPSAESRALFVHILRISDGISRKVLLEYLRCYEKTQDIAGKEADFYAKKLLSGIRKE